MGVSSVWFNGLGKGSGDIKEEWYWWRKKD